MKKMKQAKSKLGDQAEHGKIEKKALTVIA
jgi:hypothetical protein